MQPYQVRLPYCHDPENKEGEVTEMDTHVKKVTF